MPGREKIAQHKRAPQPGSPPRPVLAWWGGGGAAQCWETRNKHGKPLSGAIDEAVGRESRRAQRIIQSIVPPGLGPAIAVNPGWRRSLPTGARYRMWNGSSSETNPGLFLPSVQQSGDSRCPRFNVAHLLWLPRPSGKGIGNPRSVAQDRKGQGWGNRRLKDDRKTSPPRRPCYRTAPPANRTALVAIYL